jgi:hypothetical protein
MQALKKIWNSRKLILEGIKNSFFRRPAVEKTAFERMEICMECPLIDTTGQSCIVPGTQPCCGVCGCKLSLKTRSLASECPHPDGPRWKAKMTQHEEDVYYTKIKFNPNKDL